MVPDPYKALGLTHDASPEEIKRDYRKLAMKLHPDRLTRMQASPDEMQIASSKFAAISAAYLLLSDEKRKRDYDHIYKYGGYDELPEDSPQTQTYETNGTPLKKTPQVGIGYAVTDPFSYIMSQGKVRSRAVAGISIPSRFHMAHSPDGGFRVSFSSGQLKESPSGTLHMTSKTTQFARGKKFSKVETTTLHKDGTKEVIIEGDDYIERRFCTAPKRKRRTSSEELKDDLTHGGDDLPWYMTAWNGLRDNMQMCTNPCVPVQ
jgi:curved DNA-binding protein CbpA